MLYHDYFEQSLDLMCVAALDGYFKRLHCAGSDHRKDGAAVGY